METTVFLAVLFSALFQASWNFATKRSRADKISLLAVGWFLFGVVLLPVALWMTPFQEVTVQGLWFMLASGVVHAVYLCLLGWSYSVGDISVVYPVARGLGVVVTALGAMALGLSSLVFGGLFGVCLVVLGAMLIGWREWPRRETRRAFMGGLALAAVIGAYSLIDSEGAKSVPTLLYLTSMNLLAPLFALPFLWKNKRKLMVQIVREHKGEAFWVGLAGAIAYLIILWAYQRSPAPYVAALRESSVVVASLLGVFLLGESLYRRKIAGIVLVVAGAVVLKLI